MTDMTHFARSKIHNVVSNIRRGDNEIKRKEHTENYIGDEAYWFGESRDNVKQKYNQCPRHRNNRYRFQGHNHWCEESVEQSRSRSSMRMVGEFIQNILGSFCNGVGDTTSDWSCPNLEYRVPPTNYDQGLHRGHYFDDNRNGKYLHRREGSERSTSVTKIQNQSNKTHHNNIMDALQERIIRENPQDECFYRQRAKHNWHGRDEKSNTNVHDKLSFREVHIMKDDGRCNKKYSKNETSRMLCEEMNVAGKLPCKLSEVEPIHHHQSSSALPMNTPTLIIKNDSKKCHKNNSYNLNVISDGDDKSLETFAYDDGISVLSAHTLEEMAKLETKRKNSVRDLEPLEQGFDIIVQVEKKENNNEGYSNTLKHGISRPMLGKKETLEGDSQPPSPVGTEGSLSTDNTNNQSLYFHLSEGHRINQLNVSRPLQDFTCSTLTIGKGTGRQTTILPKMNSTKTRPFENAAKKKINGVGSNTNNIVATFAESDIKYDDNNLKNDLTNRMIDHKKERNIKIQKITKIEFPTTPKRANKKIKEDALVEDLKKTSLQDDPEVLMHCDIPKSDGTAKRKKKCRSRIPFFGRWNSVEYMQCHEEDLK